MKIYLVMGGWYDDTWIHSAHISQSTAENVAYDLEEGRIPEPPGVVRSNGVAGNRYSVDEIELED